MSEETQKTTLAPEALLYPLPRAVYKLKVIEAKLGVSSKGNPSITLEMEIIDSSKVLCKDEQGQQVEMDPNGLKLMNWVTLTPKALMFANRTNKALSMPEIQESELALVQAGNYVGKVGFAICSGKKSAKKDGQGNPLVNPHTGQPMTQNERNLDEWCLP